MAKLVKYGEWLMPAAITFGPVGCSIFPGDPRWSYLLAAGLAWLYITVVLQRRRIEQLASELDGLRSDRRNPTSGSV